MERYIVGSIWDRANRNGINDNFRYLFREAGKVTEAIGAAQKALNEANRVNGLNKDVQKQIDDLIINSGTSDAEVVQARGTHDLLNDRFGDIESKRADFEFSSNNSQPAKKGLLTNSYKVVRKIDADNMEVFQKTSKGYLRYHFRQNSGGSGYGVNYELLRVVNVEPISDVVVFSHAGSPRVGSVTPTFSFENPHNSTTVQSFFERYNADDTVTYNNDKILQPYTISGSSSVTYRLNKPTNKKMNVSFFFRTNYSTNNDAVNVYVNDRLARTIDINDSFAQGIQNFDIPVPTRATNNLDVRIENTTSNDVYIVGFNLFKLDEYNGEGVNSFIAIGSTLHPFISNSGASDYAMMNAENNSNFGSFHGGEKSNRCDILWRSGGADTSVYRAFSEINPGEFCVIEHLSLKQITILIERAYMHSNMNWNTDGTLQMDFSYQAFSTFTNSENIPFADFWTALTCTDPNFTILRQPIYMTDDGTTGHRFFKATDGYVIQETSSGIQELHSRFTRFNNEFIGTSEANSISYQEQYNKHYYAPIRYYRDTSKPVAPDVLQFSKGLDFYVY